MKRTICILLSLLLWTFAWPKDDLRLVNVVIDPGHGGHDPGAVSQDRKSQEKAFTLDISTKLATLIKEAYPDVNVRLTRTGDNYVTLEDRAAKANGSGAQLFISIHINAARNTSASGFSVHVLGQSSNKNRDLFAYNMDVCMRENSVVMLEEDFSTKYEGFDPEDPESYIFMTLMQNANLEQSMVFAQTVDTHLKGGPIASDRGVWQNPFLVLWRTSMPAVLVELGFLSNSSDLAVLRQNDNRQELARRLFEAFKAYKNLYDVSMGMEKVEALEIPAEAKMEHVIASGNDSIATDDEQEYYGVQIMAAVKLLPENSKEFLGYIPKIVKGAKFYKYVIAVSPDLLTVENEMEKIKKVYPESYIVKVKGNELSRFSK